MSDEDHNKKHALNSLLCRSNDYIPLSLREYLRSHNVPVNPSTAECISVCESSGDPSPHLARTLTPNQPIHFSFLNETVELLAYRNDITEKASASEENAPSTDSCQILEADGELSKCMFHVKKFSEYGVELRMILPELNRSKYLIIIMTPSQHSCIVIVELFSFSRVDEVK